jgi:hypothetical protein
MFTTEHRPAPLPNRAGPPVDARLAGLEVDPGFVERRLPPGASHWSMSYYDQQGARKMSKVSVPVNSQGFIAAHEYECPACGDVSRRWLPTSLKVPPVCGSHGVDLRQVQDGERRQRQVMPWREIWQKVDERVRVGAVIAATAGLGLVADHADEPWWGHTAELAAIPAAVAGSWWLTRAWLTRQAVKRGRLDLGDEVAGKRRRRLIGKRARIAAYLAAAGLSWVEIADVLGLDFTEARGWTLMAGLVAVGLVGSRPYLNYADANRQPAEATVVEELPPDESQPTDLELLRGYVNERWARLASERGPLPGTRLERIARTVGGWSAIIVAGDESELDPERFAADKTIGRIARAYGVGTTMVSITADPMDANRALILVQRTSPLARSRPWDGTGIDTATGRARTATLDDGGRIEHEFWRPGWGAVMELIAGCTGSGKSEYLNLLLALERKSRMVVSWVGDPQMGQSLGDVRDGVDWFAPTVEEILIMLRVAVQVMLARNLIITRMRVTETRPDGTIVERRIKYLEVSEDFPLLTITIDEAHLPMNDPDHGREIVNLLALLAKSGRKCNIKMRLITQSPLLSELKNSVLRAQVVSGLVTVFRTTDRVTGAAAWPGKMPGDPAALPDVWADTKETAAGVGYMSGQKPMRMRTDYAGDVYDVMHDGATKQLEDAVLGAAGVLYADRKQRLAAFDSMDPAELLGMGIPTIDAATMRGDGDDKRPGGGRDAVLRYFAERWLDGDRDPVKFGVIDNNVKAVKTRQLTNVLNKLVAETLLRQQDSWYELTERGAEELGVLEEGDF